MSDSLFSKSDKYFTSLSLEARKESNTNDIMEGVDDDVVELYEPMQFCKDGFLPMPVALSPSAAMEFQACPQSYLFQYLLGLKQPTNLVLAKGSLCHKALEQVYDLNVNDRTLENLQNLLRKAWKEDRTKEEYANLFTGENDEEDETEKIQKEREWGLSALELLSNYHQMEDPRLVPYPNPLEKEIWVRANLSLNTNDDDDDDDDDDDTFLVRGIVDRLDLVQFSTSKKQQNPTFGLRVIDYKTGKAPVFKYSPAMNSKIAEEKFWQLKIYALLLREMMNNDKIPANLKHTIGLIQERNNNDEINEPPLDVNILRLMFLTSDNGGGQYIDMDLGETKDERDATLQQVHTDLSNIWKEIQRLVSLQDPKAFVHCDRPWCHCHKVRPKFVSGTVWESTDDNHNNT